MEKLREAGASSAGDALKCFEFIPKCVKEDSTFHWPEYEQFSTLLQPMNEFLRQNPQFTVKSCETSHTIVDKERLKPQHYDYSSYMQYGETLRPFVKGARLWVTPRTATSPYVADEIGFFTFVPQINADTPQTLEYMTFKVNEYLQQNPLPGQVISIESLKMPGVKEGEVDVDASCWKPKASLAKLQFGVLSLFRIWYLRGPPQYETIGFADFFPANLTPPGSSMFTRIQTQRLPEVIQSVQHWVS